MKEGEKHLWPIFSPHHYMTHDLPTSSTFYTMYWVVDNKEILVACVGVLFQISKRFKAKRITRLVVLPEYQGLGFGSKILNTISSYYKQNGFEKIYIATFHPRLGEYMKNSDNWEASNNNLEEFKPNELAGTKTMTGLRDSVSMYRYNFIGCSKFKLLYNPVELIALKNELKELDKNSLEYKELAKLINSKSPEKIIIPIDEYLTVDNIDHIQAKEEHKRIFGRKRVPLSKEERIKAKLLKKGI